MDGKIEWVIKICKFGGELFGLAPGAPVLAMLLMLLAGGLWPKLKQLGLTEEIFVDLVILSMLIALLFGVASLLGLQWLLGKERYHSWKKNALDYDI